MNEVQNPLRFCELLYRDFHFACPYYDQDNKLLVEVINVERGEKFANVLDDTFIYYIQNGNMHLSWKGEGNFHLARNRLILLPVGAQVSAKTKDSCSFVAFRMQAAIHLCLSVDLEDLYQEVKIPDEPSPVLEANPYIQAMFDSFIILLQKGLRCGEFIENKCQELLLLLRAFYPKETLAGFFSPLLSGDALFKRRILENYKKANSVEELAGLTNYSLNGFLKKFKRNMGETPSKWINREKSRQIHRELICGNKPLKLIAEEYGFSSVSYFNQFCRKNLGSTPGRIRGKN